MDVRLFVDIVDCKDNLLSQNFIKQPFAVGLNEYNG